jgi:signal peptidase II
MDSKLRTRLPYLLLVLLTLLFDRWTKSINSRLDLNQSISVIDGLFDITYVRNTGVAFGILNTFSSPAKVVLLSVFTIGAAAIVIIYSLHSPARNRVLQAALSLILGGALGNLYDRIHYGYVIDFLEIYFRNYHWPAFNLADSAISAGVVLLALEILRHEAPRTA